MSRLILLQVSVPGRLDQALLEELRRQGLEGLSRASLKSHFGKIRAFGRGAEPSMRVEPGVVEIEIDDWAGLLDLVSPLARASTRGSFLPVVYEDEDLLVLHKSWGVPSVPLASDETETAVGAALARDGSLAGVGRGGLEPGLLHRLDTGTSGLIVFARRAEEFERLSALWRERGVSKIYRAVAGGSVSAGRADLTLGHDPGSSKRMIVVGPKSQMRGKPMEARTQVANASPLGNGHTDVEIEIETGVMHQIRVTLAFLGAPIVGDSIYRGPHSERLWLHAWKLAFPLKNGVILELESALPSDWPR